MQQQLSKLATHDDLTKLPNRTLLHELIIQSSLNSQRSQRSPTILLLDVNSFKRINDTYGRNAEDEVICEIAKRLSKTLYPKDVIARINGAEFCILVELSDPKYGAIAVARKILSCFEAAYTPDKQQLMVTASIGKHDTLKVQMPLKSYYEKPRQQFLILKHKKRMSISFSNNV
ncbi:MULTISPECIES: GGDEF domain-containing protein [unclassified Colwellia]|uniref:GGDEF domain-containing protein n=1 Tax=unclassified Colwellia TaxID=196834 RepID=UPI00287059DC|nr:MULTISPECIES: GGDEF domain-containing protein [unclassified Colwellia]